MSNKPINSLGVLNARDLLQTVAQEKLRQKRRQKLNKKLAQLVVHFWDTVDDPEFKGKASGGMRELRENLDVEWLDYLNKFSDGVKFEEFEKEFKLRLDRTIVKRLNDLKSGKASS